MGWIILIAMAAVLLLALWRIGGLDRAALQFVGAGILIAMAGYVWQGRPGLVGAPAAAMPQAAIAEGAFALLREDFMGRFDGASRWLIIAESYQRRGNTQEAAGIVRAGLRASPRDPDLWVGLGNALMLHAGDAMTPAAELAFQRALELTPGHSGARFFYGLALVREGRLDETAALWRAMLTEAPADVSWRPLVAERLAFLEAVMAGEGVRPGRGASVSTTP